jgi:hypothetical protein
MSYPPDELLRHERAITTVAKLHQQAKSYSRFLFIGTILFSLLAAASAFFFTGAETRFVDAFKLIIPIAVGLGLLETSITAYVIQTFRSGKKINYLRTHLSTVYIGILESSSLNPHVKDSNGQSSAGF